MRIAMVSEHASPLATLGSVDAGGQNVHVAALATALGRDGHVVRVYTRRYAPDLPSRVEMGDGVTVEHVDAGPPSEVPKDALWSGMPEFALRLRRALARYRPRVVHSHFWMSGWAARHAAASTGVPVVHTYHALGITKRREQGTRDTSPDDRLAVEEGLARRCERIVATSNEEIFELVRMGAVRSRLALVPCGVDLARFRPDGPAACRAPDRRRVLVVSRLVERKGIADVVRAVAALPGTELVVAGGPGVERLDADPEARRLHALASHLGVADRVRLLGRVAPDGLPALYRSADAVVCAPWYEPFGLVALEAMACGVPVVATAVGGLVDTVIHGVTGVHVPPRRPEQLTDALGRLLDDRDHARRLGAAGAARAQARYGWPTIARETARVYESARLGGVPSRRLVG
jgi:glycosyltransferase involved in cell wall biosynthesis